VDEVRLPTFLKSQKKRMTCKHSYTLRFIRQTTCDFRCIYCDKRQKTRLLPERFMEYALYYETEHNKDHLQFIDFLAKHDPDLLVKMTLHHSLPGEIRQSTIGEWMK